MRPVDPRLLREARTTRAFLAGSVLLGGVGAVLTVLQAGLIADIVISAFQQKNYALTTPLTLLAATALGRAAVAWLTELTAHRSVAKVKSTLRRRLLDHATALGPGYLSTRRTGELTTLATRGVDALDDYFARYLPQLALAVVVPAIVLLRILGADLTSAAIIAGTLPLIPLFMVLIGLATQNLMDRQWSSLARLSHHFLDVVAGLPTLKIFNRAKHQAATIARITDDYRKATLRTLRIAFISSFALELLATLSVALVAVSIGFRLVNGTLTLETGLLVLILAPEVYFPIRQVGALYHSSVEGLSAANEIFEVLETPLPTPGTTPVPDLHSATITLTALAVTDRLSPTTLTLAPHTVTALTGPSGSGKTTLLSTLLGFTTPTAGTIRINGHDLTTLDPAGWHRQIAWVPQHPHLFAGTVADNIRLARPDATDEDLRAALTQAHATDFADLTMTLGENGAGLSAGQRQRLALARALLTDRPLLLMDEPTANLDSASEQAIVATLQAMKTRTVLFIAHRPALLATATHHHLTSPTTPTTPEGREGLLRERTVPSGAPGPHTPESPAVNPATHPRLTLATALGTLALTCAVALMATSGWLISYASEMPPVLYLMMAVTSVRAFGIGRSVFRYAERLVSHDAVLRALGAIRTTVYRRLELLAPTALPAFRRGDLLSRLVSDVDAIQDHYLRWKLPAAIAVTVSVLSSLALGAFLPAAGAVLAVGLLLAGAVVPALATRLSARTERQQAPARGELATAVVDTLTGTAELTVAGALPARLRTAHAADGRLTTLAARSAATLAASTGLTTALTGLTVTAAAAVGVHAVSTGALPGVCLALVILLPLAAFEAVTGMPTAVQARARSRSASARLDELLRTEPAIVEPTDPTTAPTTAHLTAHQLSARWPGRSTDAIHGIDLDLTPGRRIAVVGPSGSGKTTLAHTLLRFLDPSSGSVTLNCPQPVDTRTIPSDEVRRSVGLCAQDAHIFDSSLRENLRLAAPTATDQDLSAALASARLLSWVQTLPDGLDTMVGEHGARLSGGQRQRLALARALLADFPVLILDEPAEHLDLPTADALTADLLAATTGRTTLLITHRLAGLEAVDEILVLDHGRVVERGTWSELTADPSTAFATTWHREQLADLGASASIPSARHTIEQPQPPLQTTTN
ncbi:ATP-binding cassette subfamily C protein CydCD [Kitasatospora gansuensis]|uniref:ATP-binding cassette subfamily C protein CydCD n=1 Tax=Kitasatospora gansuensis TaxID=258050 RepID=A0A7W7WI70_9ACTN|nr:thiol reductant ABC exporter subunit CydD [Kitasatospora gansuensis]MBB4947956.1 ATP-binding cassette subfamily C protein CydCD [Kitasatospora gansuensis]